MPRRFCIETINGIICGQVFTGNTQRCPTHQAAHNTRLQQQRGTTTQRGYGTDHQAERERQLALWQPGQPCAICHRPTYDKTRLDLAHNETRTGYKGLAHDTCNRGHHG